MAGQGHQVEPRLVKSLRLLLSGEPPPPRLSTFRRQGVESIRQGRERGVPQALPPAHRAAMRPCPRFCRPFMSVRFRPCLLDKYWIFEANPLLSLTRTAAGESSGAHAPSSGGRRSSLTRFRSRRRLMSGRPYWWPGLPS